MKVVISEVFDLLVGYGGRGLNNKGNNTGGNSNYGGCEFFNHCSYFLK
jgi:hypothetical protein